MEPQDTSANQKTWLERISQVLSGEPKDRSELLELLRDASEREVLPKEALGMMEGALQVTEKQVRDIMIPRAQMAMIQANMPLADISSRIIEGGFSRYPVIEEGRDEIIGVLIAKDILKYAFEPQKKFRIKDILRPAIFVPESIHLNDLLKQFKHSHQHMVIVINEYGGTAGLATLEDVLEEIVGEIEDEHDPEEETYIQQSSNRRFIVKATTPVEEFNKFFQANLKMDDIDTIGGIINKTLGYLPKRGEKVQVDSFKFTILHADNRRIKLLKLLLDKPLQKT